jgi:hypothetical protein
MLEVGAGAQMEQLMRSINFYFFFIKIQNSKNYFIFLILEINSTSSQIDFHIIPKVTIAL